MSFSPKITSASVAAAATALVGGIVGPHVFPHGTPSDVKGLGLAVASAGVTFVSGYLTKHRVDPVALADDAYALADDLHLPFTQIPEWFESEEDTAPVAQPDPAAAPVAAPVAVEAAPVAPVAAPSVPVAE